MGAVATVRPTLVLDGVEVSLARAGDGVLVVEIETPDVSDADANYDDTPRLRVWVNDALIHDANGECTPIEAAESPLIGAADAGSPEPFCACGRRFSQCDGSRRGCGQ